MITDVTEGFIAFLRTAVTAVVVFEVGCWMATAYRAVRGQHAAAGLYLAISISVLLAALAAMAWRSHTRTRVAVWTVLMGAVALVCAVPLLSL